MQPSRCSRTRHGNWEPIIVRLGDNLGRFPDRYHPPGKNSSHDRSKYDDEQDNEASDDELQDTALVALHSIIVGAYRLLLRCAGYVFWVQIDPKTSGLKFKRGVFTIVFYPPLFQELQYLFRGNLDPNHRYEE